MSEAGNAAGAVKDELHRRIDEMTADEALDLLDFLNMLADPDTLTDEETERADRAEAEMRAGKYVTLPANSASRLRILSWEPASLQGTQ